MSRAVAGAAEDLAAWTDLLRLGESAFPDGREVDVTGFDPEQDLRRRGRRWGHELPSTRLPDVVAFGVALAGVEFAAWGDDDPVVATRAYEDRRFLFGDRLVHWVVPMALASVIPAAADLCAAMLRLGDRLRVAPDLTGTEGLHPPGEDSFGPFATPLAADLGDPARWERLAEAHPGTARLWRDLARRASGS